MNAETEITHATHATHVAAEADGHRAVCTCGWEGFLRANGPEGYNTAEGAYLTAKLDGSHHQNWPDA